MPHLLVLQQIQRPWGTRYVHPTELPQIWILKQVWYILGKKTRAKIFCEAFIACSPGVLHHGTITESMKVSVWFSRHAAFNQICYLWCQKDDDAEDIALVEKASDYEELVLTSVTIDIDPVASSGPKFCVQTIFSRIGQPIQRNCGSPKQQSAHVDSPDLLNNRRTFCQPDVDGSSIIRHDECDHELL